MEKKLVGGGYCNQHTLNRGFTLVELLAVIVIIGLLATIGTITVTKIISNSEKKALVEEGINLAAAGKYAYETNDSTANLSQVCFSMQTLNETGYYEKGSKEKYNGSVLVTKDDNNKVSVKFWINKDGEKAIEGADLTVTEDKVVDPKITTWNNTESAKNGSYCNLSEEDLNKLKESGGIPGKTNLKEYTGDKIEIDVNTGNITIESNISDIPTCKSGGNSACPPTPGEEVPNPPTTCTGNNCDPNNYAVFYDDRNNTKFRILGQEEVTLENGSKTTLYKIIQEDYATVEQVGNSAISKENGQSGYTEFTYDSEFGTVESSSSSHTEVGGGYYNSRLKNSLASFSYMLDGAFTNGQIKIDWDKSKLNTEILNGKYLNYLKKSGIDVDNKIAKVRWNVGRGFNQDTQIKKGASGLNAQSLTTGSYRIGLMSIKDVVSNGGEKIDDTVDNNYFYLSYKADDKITYFNYLYKGLNELLIDLGGENSHAMIIKAIERTDKNHYGGIAFLDHRTESNVRNNRSMGHIRPAMYLAPGVVPHKAQGGTGVEGSYDNPLIIS